MSNIYGPPLWKLLFATLLAHEVLRCNLVFGKIYAALVIPVVFIY